MGYGQNFHLFDEDTNIGDTDDASTSSDDYPETRADEILLRLQKLQRHQESATEEELYNQFSFGGPYVDAPGEAFTNEVASAVVDFFHCEAAAGRRWKSLNIFIISMELELFGKLLEGAKSSRLFSACWIYPGGNNIHDQQSEERILQQFCRGNSSLEELEWHPVLSPATLGRFDEMLHAVSCGIKHLTLGFGGSRVSLPLINVLEGCHSLRCIRFYDGKIDQHQGYRILNLVNTCPHLQEIDLYASELTGDQFWSRLIPDQCSLDARKRLYRLRLPQSFVRRLWRGLPHKVSLVKSSDQDIFKLLQVFPALGSFGDLPLGGYWASAIVVFSLRTAQLLAFNYAGRAQLDQSLRPRLWKPVLERVIKGARNGMVFLQREELMHQKRALVLSCQASVLFSLLKHDPTVLTPEACRVQPPSTSLLSSVGLL